MNKKLPEIFKSQSDRLVNNNKCVFYSRYESVGNVSEEFTEETNVVEKSENFSSTVDNFFKNNQFIFNVPVEIVTKDKSFDTKIISKVGDHLLTIGGEVISLVDLVSVKLK